MGKERTPAEIEAEIAAARERLANNVEALVNQVHPRAVAQRGLRQARELVSDKKDALKKEVVAADGSWRTDRVAVVLAAFAGVVVLITLLHKLIKR